MNLIRLHAARGFTLVEMIVVIVLTGIIASFIAMFLRKPVQAYFESEARAEISDVSDSALRRIARDVRLAVPNSVRASPDGRYLELLLTKTGGRYLEEEELAAGDAVTKPLGFTNPSNLVFQVIGPPLPASGPQQIVAGDYVVISNFGNDVATRTNNAYYFNQCVTPDFCNIARVAAVAGNNITLVSNPFASQWVAAGQNEPPLTASRAKRFQVVSGPVTYACDLSTGTLKRYANYAIVLDQPDTPAEIATLGTPALLANNVTDCYFSSQQVASTIAAQQTGILGIYLTVQKNGESVKLFHEVHVDNTP